jgi:hypothetical protein
MANRASGERVFSAPADAVRAAVAEALRELGWEWKPGPHGGIEAIWTSRVFRFKDDVEIEIVADTGPGSRVRVHSRSRIGHYDWGQNARHVRDLFGAIEEALSLRSTRRA